MKKLLVVALLAALVCPAFAQDQSSPKDDPKPTRAQREERRQASALWPAFFAVYEWPATLDLIGLRLTIPYSTKQESVTGFDIGFWGRAINFEGVQINILRNDVKDEGAGLQLGLYNSMGSADFLAAQVGLWNESMSFRGLQLGLVNYAGEAQGLQIGLINRTETMYGFQIGLINVIREGELRFCPIINIGF